MSRSVPYGTQFFNLVPVPGIKNGIFMANLSPLLTVRVLQLSCKLLLSCKLISILHISFSKHSLGKALKKTRKLPAWFFAVINVPFWNKLRVWKRSYDLLRDSISGVPKSSRTFLRALNNTDAMIDVK